MSIMKCNSRLDRIVKRSLPGNGAVRTYIAWGDSDGQYQLTFESKELLTGSYDAVNRFIQKLVEDGINAYCIFITAID